MNKLRKIGLAVFMLLAMLFSAAFVMKAQEPLVTNTAAEVTAAAPVEPAATVVVPVVAPVEPTVDTIGRIYQDNADTRTLLVALLVIVLAISAVERFSHTKQVGTLLAGYKDIINDQRVVSEAQRLYTESSLSVKQAVEFARGFMNVIGSMNIPGVDAIADPSAAFLNRVTTAPSGGNVITNAAGNTYTLPDDVTRVEVLPDDDERVNTEDLQRTIRSAGGMGTKPLDDNNAAN